MHFNDLMKDLYYSSDEDKPIRGRPKGKKTRLTKDEQRARNAELEAKRRLREKKGYMALAIALGIDPHSMTRDEILATALCLIKENQQPLDDLKQRNNELERQVKECKSLLASETDSAVLEPSPKRHRPSKVVVESLLDNAADELCSQGGEAVTASTASAAPTSSNTSQPSSTIGYSNNEHTVLGYENPLPAVADDFVPFKYEGVKLECSTTQDVVSSCLPMPPPVISPHSLPSNDVYNQSIMMHQVVKNESPTSTVNSYVSPQYGGASSEVSTSQDVFSSLRVHSSMSPVTNFYGQNIPPLQPKIEQYSPDFETGISQGIYSNAAATEQDYYVTNSAVTSSAVDGFTSYPVYGLSSYPVDESTSCPIDAMTSSSVDGMTSYHGDNISSDCWYESDDQKCEIGVEDIIAEIPPSISDGIMKELTNYYLNTSH